MKKILLMIVGAIFVCASVFAAEINGKWKAEFDNPMGTQHYIYEFHVDGTTLTGTAKNDQGQTDIKEGKVDGNTITFVENLDFDGNAIRIVYTGKIEGDQINFSRQVGDFATETLVATRVK